MLVVVVDGTELLLYCIYYDRADLKLLATQINHSDLMVCRTLGRIVPVKSLHMIGLKVSTDPILFLLKTGLKS